MSSFPEIKSTGHLIFSTFIMDSLKASLLLCIFSKNNFVKLTDFCAFNCLYSSSVFGIGAIGRGFSFRAFNQRPCSRRGIRFEAPGGINLKDIFGQTYRPPSSHNIRYEITITREQAAQGLEKDLVRKGKKLRVKIPAGVKTGMKVRLRNARQKTDGQPGDIIILVRVK